MKKQTVLSRRVNNLNVACETSGIRSPHRAIKSFSRNGQSQRDTLLRGVSFSSPNLAGMQALLFLPTAPPYLNLFY